MKAVLILTIAAMLALVGCSTERAQAPLSSQNSEGAYSGAEAELDALLAQIQNLDEQGADVPEEVYARYFELEEQLHPEFYSRQEAIIGALDELSDACPGPIVYLPAGEQYYSISTTCGQTYNSVNNCTYPNCRYGRDVLMQIDVWYPGWISMTTTGSRFDTYLCLYEGGCCGEEGSELIGYNNNNPDLCNGQFLAAGMNGCIFPGTYWLVLDGASPSARGSYCMTVEFWAGECEF